MESPYFRSAEVIPRMDEVSEDLRVPIRVRISPMKLNYYEIGVSVASDSGPGLEGVYERRWLNRRGHSFRTQLSPSIKRSFFTAAYTMPHRKRLDRAFVVGIDALDETTDTNEKRNFAYSLSYQRRWQKWRRTSSLRYLGEDWIAGGEPGSSALLLAQGTFSRKVPAHKMVPTQGWSLTAGYKLASDSVASDTSMIQVEALLRNIQSFGESWRLLGRLNLGMTWVDDFDLLPASLRYYAGGDRSIRGYDFETLGPRNEEGLVIGGENLAILSLEIEHSLSESLRLAAFVDYGNALKDWDGELEAGAGIGARLATPVGMIRLDVAYPLTVDDGKVRIHFTVGPDL